MDRFTRADLHTLMVPQGTRCVTVCMPTHRTGPEIREDALRCKNLLSRAEEQLQALGLRSPAAREIMKPAWDLHGDELFWRNQSDGLALFLSPGQFKYFRVPLALEELVIANQRFHLKALLPLLQDDGRFYLLSVSQKQVRLFTGTHYSISRIQTDKLPSSLQEALNIDEYVDSLQLHGHTMAGVGGAGAREGIFHGHGGSEPGVKKNDELREFVRRIDDGLTEFFGDERAPLVFAGVEYLFPIFREACSYRHLVQTPVRGNPDLLSERDLHDKAWELVAPVIRKAQDAAVERFGDLLSSGRSIHEPHDVVSAAVQGRVETLLIERNGHLWGRVGESCSIELLPRQGAGTEDLLDFAALHTLLHRGSVYVLDQARMPEGRAMAAIVRYVPDA
jgi:hypothetical protein